MLDSFILIAVAFAFLYFGYSHKDYSHKDYTTFLFSSIAFFFAGLNIIIVGYHNVGLLFIGYGFYIGIRSGVELIKDVFNKKKEGTNNGRKESRRESL